MSYLRDYQQTCVSALWDALAANRSTLFVQPTGTGKTETFLEFSHQWIDRTDSDVLILAHREELVMQPAERWRRKTGEYAEVEMGEFRRSTMASRSRLTCGSKDTLWRDKRLRSAFPDPKQVGLIVIDEAHHAVRENKTYQAVLDYFPHAKIVGATATPDRTDEQALGQTFESVAFEYPLLDPEGGPSAIGDGWLVPIRQQYVTVEDLDFGEIKTRGGDFVDADLEKVLLEERPLLKVTSATFELATGRPTVLFTSGTAHAARSAEQLNRFQANSAAAVVSRIDNEMRFDFVVTDRDARRRVLAEFAQGKLRYLVNVGCFTEGFDEPTIAVVSMGRPTKSRSLYAQMAGRGTRILPGTIEGRGENGPWRLQSPDERRAAIAASAKPYVTILDFVGNSQHSLISAADILGGNYPDELVAAAKEEIQQRAARGESVDVRAALEQAQRAAAREADRRSAIKARARIQTQAIDPFTILGVTPRREPAWHKDRKPSERQIETLRKFKVDEKTIADLTFVKASSLLDKLVERVQAGKCSLKQAQLLAKYGQPTDLSFDEARARIDMIAANGWRGRVHRRVASGVRADGSAVLRLERQRQRLDQQQCDVSASQLGDRWRRVRAQDRRIVG